MTFGVSPAIVGLLIFSNIGTAQAGLSTEQNFFDFKFAQRVWTEFSDPEIETWLSSKCAKGTAYDQWQTSYKQAPQQALKALEAIQDAKEIKQCNDVLLTFEQWSEIYGSWRSALKVYGGAGWNKNPNNIGCLSMATMNIFTGSCNDLPDWRNPAAIIEDKAWMAQGNSRWKKRK